MIVLVQDRDMLSVIVLIFGVLWRSSQENPLLLNDPTDVRPLPSHETILEKQFFESQCIDRCHILYCVNDM